MILESDAGGRMLVPVEPHEELVRVFDRSGFSGPRLATLSRLKYQTFATPRRPGQDRGNFDLDSRLFK